jgi:hypothetical protein
VISKKLVLVLSLCVAGSLIPLQGAACVNTTFDVILATNGGVCSIGAYTFAFGPFNIVGHSGSVTPSGGLTAADLNFSTISNANGTGFLLAPNVTFSANSGGNIDSELQYKVTAALASNLNSIYLDVTGTGTGGAFDHVLEEYCLGGTTLPPAGSGFCTGDPSLAQHNLDAYINNGASPAAVSATFSNQTSIAILKDIDVNGGTTTGSSSITGIFQQFGPVPEPGTYVLSFIGLGLFFLGKRKFTRS